MENILKSILATEKEAEEIAADAKAAAQKISQDAAEAARRWKADNEKAVGEKVDAALARIRQEAMLAKDKILAQAQVQAHALEKQAQVRMAQAVGAALNRLLQTD